MQFDIKNLLSGNEDVAIPVEASMPPNYFITTGFSFSYNNLMYVQTTTMMTYNAGNEITVHFLLCELQNVFCRTVNMATWLNACLSLTECTVISIV
jgi:hypothetical protein